MDADASHADVLNGLLLWSLMVVSVCSDRGTPRSYQHTCAHHAADGERAMATFQKPAVPFQPSSCNTLHQHSSSHCHQTTTDGSTRSEVAWWVQMLDRVDRTSPGLVSGDSPRCGNSPLGCLWHSLDRKLAVGALNLNTLAYYAKATGADHLKSKRSS